LSFLNHLKIVKSGIKKTGLYKISLTRIKSADIILFADEYICSSLCLSANNPPTSEIANATVSRMTSLPVYLNFWELTEMKSLQPCGTLLLMS